MKKKLKGLEDQIKKLSGTNAALTNTVRALQKGKQDTHHRTDNDGSSSDGEDDSPMLFASWKVRMQSSPSHWLTRHKQIMVTSQANPDAARQQKRQPQGNKGWSSLHVDA